jgi:Flp pilus assembly protein TadD
MIGSAPGIERALMQAGELLQQGKNEQAAEICASVLATVPNQPAATHFLGLARARLGAVAEAEQLLRRSLSLDPANPHFRVNFGNFLRRLERFQDAEFEYRAAASRAPDLRTARHQLALTLDDLGRRSEAEVECRRLLGQQPGDAEAWSLLGYILNKQQRLLESETAYRKSLELTPNYGLAHHNLGSVLVQMERAEEALAALERAETLGVPPFELHFSRGRALTLLYRVDEAEQAYERATAARPQHIEAQLNLARLRFMRADPFFARTLERALGNSPEHLGLGSLYASILYRSGNHSKAEAQLRNLMARHGALPQLRTQLAQMLLETGRLKEAETEALEAAGQQPRDGATLDTLVSVLLARGRPDEALSFILNKRVHEPLNQSWIAHEGIAGRLLGKPHHRELFDYERFVRVYRPEAPAGWTSMVELNAALVATLTGRQRFTTHPLEQSLRNGSQTTRNLKLDPDPVIQAVLRSFEAPLRQYLADIGTHPSHPLLVRNRGSARISEGWSIELRRDGFHVNHVHPKGWISSAYYVSLPTEVSDTQARSGWLKFGEPRFPAQSVGPEFSVQPEEGMLVLFPSYLWHGTTAIVGEAPRITIAFDAVPDTEDSHQPKRAI